MNERISKLAAIRESSFSMLAIIMMVTIVTAIMLEATSYLSGISMLVVVPVTFLALSASGLRLVNKARSSVLVISAYCLLYVAGAFFGGCVSGLLWLHDWSVESLMTSVVLPSTTLLAPALLVTMPVALGTMVVRRVRRWQLIERRRCPDCGYPLYDGHCPECAGHLADRPRFISGSWNRPLVVVATVVLIMAVGGAVLRIDRVNSRQQSLVLAGADSFPYVAMTTAQLRSHPTVFPTPFFRYTEDTGCLLIRFKNSRLAGAAGVIMPVTTPDSPHDMTVLRMEGAQAWLISDEQLTALESSGLSTQLMESIVPKPEASRLSRGLPLSLDDILAADSQKLNLSTDDF